MYTTTWIVRTGDTDFSGRVYTPEAVNHFVQAIENLMGEFGMAPNESVQQGIVYPAVHAEVDYHDAISVGDTVTIALTSDVGHSSIKFDLTGTREGTTVIEGSVTLVFLDVETHESVKVPDDVREALDRHS
jgi:acyl-CoA thioesterase FadM